MTNMSPTSDPSVYAQQRCLTLIANDHYPFMIGANGYSGPFGNPNGVDLRVYGLRLSNTIRYQNNGAGQKQVRTDSPASPINDAYAYFGIDANTICFLKGQDNPATSGRVVSVQHGNVAVTDGISVGLILHTLENPINYDANAIRNIQLEGASGYGQVISIGAVYSMTIENVRAVNGFHGIGSFIIAASYYIYLRSCWLSGYDAGYFGAMQLLDAREVYFATSGRVTMRHLGCNARWDDGVWSPGWSPTSECIFKARSFPYGGSFRITNLMVDFLRADLPTCRVSVIYCEAMPQVPATSLLMSDIFVGTVGASTSLVMLKDLGPETSATHKCWFSLENMQAFTNTYAAVVDVDGPLWHGEVKGVGLVGPQFNHRQKWGSNTNVVIRDTKYVGSPRTFLWYNGAHSLDVRSPADGQYGNWRCVRTGTYGTPTPPLWFGSNTISIAPNGLAGYVLNHIYMTASLH